MAPVIINPYRFAVTSSADFIDRFDDDTGWSLGDVHAIGSGVFTSTLHNGASHTNSYKSIGFTLSDTLWYMDYDMKVTGDGNEDMYKQFLIGVSNSSGKMTAGTGDWCADGSAQNWSDFHPETRGSDGATTDWNTEGSNLTHGTQYFNRMERQTSTTLQVDWHDDSDRTTSVGGTGSTGWGTLTINSTNGGQSYLSMGGGTGGTQSSVIDNVFIYDSVAP